MISKHSIAVLPFVNISYDRDNEYFSDGVTEEIVNALCRFEELYVTSRTSSFAFRNQNTDIREIGKKLNIDGKFNSTNRKNPLFMYYAPLTDGLRTVNSSGSCLIYSTGLFFR